MADQKISELTAITGANTADDDLLVIVDTSTGETKKITLAELEAGIARGDMTFGDNDKAIFGAGSDLQIYHDSASGNSYIKESGSGTLWIQGANLQLVNENASSQYAVGVDGGAFSLMYAGNAKLATTSTGIDVTGTVVADGLTLPTSEQKIAWSSGNAIIEAPNDLYIRSTSTGTIRLQDNVDVTGTATMDGLTVDGTALVENGNKVRVERPDGLTYSEFYMDTGANGGTQIYNHNNDGFKFHQGNGQTKLTIAGNGDISFYEDTGTTAKFFWDASAESLALGHSTPSSTYALDVSGKGMRISATAPSIEFQETDTSNQRWSMLGLAGDFTIRDITGGTYPLHIEASAPNNSIRVDSSGNVGIGTSTDNGRLNVYEAGGETQLKLRADSAHGSAIYFTEATSGYRGFIAYDNVNEVMKFSTNSGGERMRLDASGNLLVGTTTTNNGLASSGSGIDLGNGYIQAAKALDNPILANRTGNDGSIISLRKDGTTVGSIGVSGGMPYFTNPTAGYGGLRFDAYRVLPATSAGAGWDNSIDLGAGSTRFRDLYISGGVYLGGTGASNHLDDYETGTWTGTLIGGTTAGNSPTATGTYSKVGNVVTVVCRFTNLDTTGATGQFIIQGLPFAGSSGPAVTGSVWNNRASSSGGMIMEIASGTTEARAYDAQGGSKTWISNGIGTYVGFTAVYRTS